ncbi:MAG: Crp/Fnr family transcriptional regulator, partial [Tannerellaceae bacterium]
MKRIIQSINRIAKISDEAMNAFTACLQPLEVTKRSILIEPGKKNPNIYFIEKGITRSFTIVDGKEVTSWFSKEGDITFSTNSFYGATEGYETETVQALENTLIYY